VDDTAGATAGAEERRELDRGLDPLEDLRPYPERVGECRNHDRTTPVG
jgi:hypothetical protein